jgi:hypothetical protein
MPRPRYVFAQQVPWGDGWSTIGDEVPDEPGRDYGTMERAGQIVRVPQRQEEQMNDKEQERPPTHLEQERQAGDRGLVTTVPPVPDAEEAAAGVQDADHRGTGSPTRADLPALAARRQAEQEALGQVPVPPTADQQRDAGQRPATQPEEQTAQQQAGAAPQDVGASENRGPVSPADAEADQATREGRDQAAAAPEPGEPLPPLVGPGSGQPQEAREENPPATGGDAPQGGMAEDDAFAGGKDAGDRADEPRD